MILLDERWPFAGSGGLPGLALGDTPAAPEPRPSQEGRFGCVGGFRRRKNTEICRLLGSGSWISIVTPLGIFKPRLNSGNWNSGAEVLFRATGCWCEQPSPLSTIKSGELGTFFESHTQPEGRGNDDRTDCNLALGNTMRGGFAGSFTVVLSREPPQCRPDAHASWLL
jgi:hypothetical protein